VATLNDRGLVHLKLNDAEGGMADYDSVLATNPDRRILTLWAWPGKTEIRRRRGGGADMQAATAIQPDIADQFAKWGITGKP
jgi:hypothetical protein